MESEVKLKEGMGEDPEMTASESKKGNATIGLVGGKQESNEVR